MSLTIHAVELQTSSNDNVVAFRLIGKLTKEDYKAFVPAIEDRIEQCGKIRLLVDLIDFHGWTVGAAWEDLKFDFKHFLDIERIALVGESKWEKGMELFCRPFTAAKIRYFNVADRESAIEWIEQPN